MWRVHVPCIALSVLFHNTQHSRSLGYQNLFWHECGLHTIIMAPVSYWQSYTTLLLQVDRMMSGVLEADGAHHDEYHLRIWIELRRIVFLCLLKRYKKTCVGWSKLDRNFAQEKFSCKLIIGSYQVYPISIAVSRPLINKRFFSLYKSTSIKGFPNFS